MAQTKKGVILCVDDDPDVLNSIVTVLQSEGYKTVCAENGVVGLEMFEKNKKKLWGILTDARMPKMNGLEFASKVRETGADVPIVLVTAYMARQSITGTDQGITVKEYHDAGINAHMEKPFRLDDLLHAVEITFDPYGLSRDRKKKRKK